MSVRNFERVFTEVGTTPRGHVAESEVEEAARQLERSDSGLKHGRGGGFGNIDDAPRVHACSPRAATASWRIAPAALGSGPGPRSLKADDASREQNRI